MEYENTEAESAFGFDGNWKDFARIALPNLLLTIVTLGIYRFWATTRERQYLWAHTRFVDERLEWQGRGIELFIGFLLVAAIVGIPFALLQFISQGLIFRGMIGWVAGLTFALFFITYYLTGMARFRAALSPVAHPLARNPWGQRYSGVQIRLVLYLEELCGPVGPGPDGALVDDQSVERTLERHELWPV